MPLTLRVWMSLIKGLRRVTHETLSKAFDDYGRRLAFNTVVAAAMTLMNHINKFDGHSSESRAVLREALKAVVLVLSPITPHIRLLYGAG